MLPDHHFPKFHLRPRTGYVNDPNGPIHIDGRWHLYFQYVSDTAQGGAVVWGHASSPDLARWTYHRPALSPDPAGGDRDGCWSGTTIASDGRVIAFYSGRRREHPYQSVLAAVSHDGGSSFGPPHPVVPDPDPSEQVAQFRDPFVWREADRWLMLVGAGDRSGRGSARLYASPDLTDWRYQGVFAVLPRTVADDYDTGEMWECPQLLSFGERDALLISPIVPGGGGKVLALTGTREDDALSDIRISAVDHGPNLYAASALRDGPAGPLIWGWVTEGRSRDWAIEAGWSGMLSLPRSVDLTADGRLVVQPFAGLETLRSGESAPTQSTGSTVTFADLGAQFEIELDLGSTPDTEDTRLTLHCGADEHLDLVVDRGAGRIRIDRDHAGRDPRAHRGICSFEEPALRSRGPVRLRWFVDGSVSELFTSTGHCSTLRFYPSTPPPWRLEIGGLAATATVRAWALDGLAEERPADDDGRFHTALR